MKRFSLIVAAAVLALAVCSCGGSAQPKETKKKSDIPVWYSNPPQDDTGVYAIANARKSSMQLALEAAKNRARDELSRTVSVNVANLIKDHLKESGANGISVSTELSANVSKSLTANTLSGSALVQQEVYEIDQDGDGNTDIYEVYVLMKISDVGKRISDAMKENRAAFAEMEAEKAFEELESELAKLRWTDPQFKAEPRDYED